MNSRLYTGKCVLRYVYLPEHAYDVRLQNNISVLYYSTSGVSRMMEGVAGKFVLDGSSFVDEHLLSKVLPEVNGLYPNYEEPDSYKETALESWHSLLRSIPSETPERTSLFFVVE